jgi:hypothetical protein
MRRLLDQEHVGAQLAGARGRDEAGHAGAGHEHG